MGWLSSFISNPIQTIGETGQKVVNKVSNVGQSIIDTVKDHPLEAAALIAGGYYFAPEIGAWVSSDGTALAGTAEGGVAAGTQSLPAAELQRAAATEAANVAAQQAAGPISGMVGANTVPLDALTTGSGLSTTGSGLGLTAGNTANLASMGGAQGLTTLGTTGTTLGATGGALAAGGLGAGLGYGSAALGAGTALGAAGLTASQLGTASLIQGGLGLAGGLLGGQSAADAQAQAAQQYAKLAQQGANMANFRPVGTTTTFGTSNFQIDPTTGQLTSAGYALSPQLQEYQNQIMAGNRQSLTDVSNLQNLGRGYIAQSPQEAAQQWMANQQALLAPSRDLESARLANQLQQTGRTGVSVAQGGNLGMANPEQQALANARAMQDLQLAAGAQQAGQAQTTFGQGLLSNAYQPFNAGLTTAANVEQLGQQPFSLSTNLANLSSTAGARAGQILAGGMGNSITAQQAANSYNPWATAIQGAASNPLTGVGLLKALS